MDTPTDIVKAIAETYKLTDQAIATRVGGTQPTIWRLRTGKSKTCGSDLYLALHALRAELQRERAELEAVQDAAA